MHARVCNVPNHNDTVSVNCHMQMQTNKNTVPLRYAK